MWKLLEANCDRSFVGHASLTFLNVAAFFLNKVVDQEAAEEEKHLMGSSAVLFAC